MPPSARLGWALFCLALLLPLLATPAQAAGPPGCAELVAQFLAQDDWMAALVDPIASNPAEVEALAERYARLYACLESGSYGDRQVEPILRRLTSTYLLFARGGQALRGGAPDSSSLELVDLATSSDPAVLRLRQELGLPPPPGLVFVRFYRSYADMPPLVQEAFKDPHTAGATLLSRYVAVLDEDGRGASDGSPLSVTVSHELAHAYINAALGPSRQAAVPAWYSEGLAIYFSGSGQVQVTVLFGVELRRSPPEDYRQYELNMRFLEARLGRAAFLEAVRASVAQADPAYLYRTAGFNSEAAFLLAARGWQEQRSRALWLAGLAVLAAALGALVLAWRWWPGPRAVCDTCGYVGRPDEFDEGWCPNCNSPYMVEER